MQGRSGSVVDDWLTERGTEWCAGVQVAALDPFRGYDTGFRGALPTATVVLDPFYAEVLVMPRLLVLLRVRAVNASVRSA